MNARERAQTIVLFALPGGLVLGGGYLAFRWYKRRRLVLNLSQSLRAGLSEIGRLYADELAEAAAASCPPDVDPQTWAFTFAGIIERESGFGAFLSPRGPNGLGDYGHGHGLGQVDDRWNSDEPELSRRRMRHLESGDWTDPRKHLTFCAVEVFRRAYDQLPQLGGDERLKAAAAAYNAGAPAVLDALSLGADPDSVTTKKNYGRDVLARAASFAERAA